MIHKSQIPALVFFSGLFMLLYFGCDTKSKEHKLEEKSREQNFELVNVDRLISEAAANLDGTGKATWAELTQLLKRSENDSIAVRTQKSIASFWYAQNQPLISGHYAEKVAVMENTVDAWNIAGTTYSIAAQRASEENQKEHAVKKSREVLEMALSLDPNNMDTRINLALSHVESEAPMRGIMMLKELNEEQPDNIPVLMQLAKLSIRSGQMDKAVERLTKIIDLRGTFREAHCLLYSVYTQKGESALAEQQKALCDTH